MTKLISFDWAIKKILRSKANFSVLEGFLSELIAPDKDLKIVRLLESEGNKDTQNDKLNRVDILVELEPGDLVLIEVQASRQIDFLHRLLFGTSKIVTEYLAEGDAYGKIKKVYSVSILYFDLGQGADYIYKGTTDFIGVHTHEYLQLTEKQKILYKKELVRDIYPEYFLIKVNNFDDLAKNTLDEWIYFFKNETIKSEFKAKGLLKAKEIFDIMNLPEEEAVAYKRYQENLHYQASMVDSSYGEGKLDGRHEGREEGLAEGIAKGMADGIAKGKAEIINSMLQNDLPIEKISAITGLSVEIIKAIATK